MEYRIEIYTADNMCPQVYFVEAESEAEAEDTAVMLHESYGYDARKIGTVIVS